jgi:hypothetical protein
MAHNMITLTHENLHATGTHPEAGGWNYRQLEILGVKDFSKGWLSKLIGKRISEKNYAELLALKGMRIKRPKKSKTERKLSSHPTLFDL